MSDQVWRVTVFPTVFMYFWNKTKANRYAADRQLPAPILTDRPDGQPVN